MLVYPYFLLPPPQLEVNPYKDVGGRCAHCPQGRADSEHPLGICGTDEHVRGSVYTAVTQDFCRLQSDHTNAGTGEGMEYSGKKNRQTSTSLT